LNIYETVLRETKEEIGIDLRKEAIYMGRLDDIIAMARGRALDMAITPFIFMGTAPLEIKPSEEVDAFVWVPLLPMIEGELDSTTTWKRGNFELFLPCYKYEGYIIWGLTYQMLQHFFSAVRNAIVEV